LRVARRRQGRAPLERALCRRVVPLKTARAHACANIPQSSTILRATIAACLRLPQNAAAASAQGAASAAGTRHDLYRIPYARGAPVVARFPLLAHYLSPLSCTRRAPLHALPATSDIIYLSVNGGTALPRTYAVASSLGCIYFCSPPLWLGARLRLLPVVCCPRAGAATARRIHRLSSHDGHHSTPSYKTLPLPVTPPPT